MTHPALATADPATHRRTSVAIGQCGDPSCPDSLKESFENLVRETLGRLQWYCLRLCSSADAGDDLTQEALLTAWTHFRTFESRHPAAFFKWTTMIALNHYRRAIRRRSSSPMRSIHEQEIDPSAPSNDVLEELASRDTVAQIRALVLEFDEGIQTAFQLRTESDMGWDEIGKLMELNPNTVRTRFKRMCQSIEEQLSD